MKHTWFALVFFLSALLMGQQKPEGTITISEPKGDDIYLASETIDVDALVNGDVVVAGGEIVIRDSVRQDVLAAGGEIKIMGYVADDIRAAGGTLTIDAEIGDDVIIAGGDVFISKNTVIHGNLVNFSGNIEMNGLVMGMMKSFSGDLNINGNVGGEAQLYGEDIRVNGEIKGATNIAAEEIEIGDRATFHNDVHYWSEDKNTDFKDALVNARAIYSEELVKDRNQMPWKGVGLIGVVLFILYILAAFLILLLLNWAFGKLFSKAVHQVEKDLWPSLGYGLLYLFGVPLIILITFVVVVGIPISLFLFSIYLFSILFGHLIAALLFTHYLNTNRNWKFWPFLFIALGIAIVFRLFTLIPFLGGLISIILMSLAYGVFIALFLERRKLKKAL